MNYRAMTKEQLLERNPWKDIAEQIKPNVTNCLYDNSNEYVIQGKEKDRIIAFNNALKNTDDSDKIVLQTPPEPWRGNPLTANLIILTLNPGYDLNINKTLACLIQAIDDVRIELINFRKQTLKLESDSMMPKKQQKNNPISCFEAEDMLSGWYWTKNLKKLREASQLEEDDFYKKIAVIEFHGYSSTTCKKGFPLCGKESDYLDSQNYNKELIKYIIDNRSTEIRFLIVRAKNQWTTFLGDLYNADLFLSKGNKGRNPSISKNNLAKKNEDGTIDNDVFDQILSVLK